MNIRLRSTSLSSVILFVGSVEICFLFKHELVDPFDEIVKTLYIVVIDTAAGRGCQLIGLTRRLVILFAQGIELFDGLFNLPFIVCILNDDELVARIADRDAAVADRAAQDGGIVDQGAVALGMAKIIVDALEMVDIRHNNTDLAVGIIDRVADEMVEIGSVV